MEMINEIQFRSVPALKNKPKRRSYLPHCESHAAGQIAQAMNAVTIPIARTSSFEAPGRSERISHRVHGRLGENHLYYISAGCALSQAGKTRRIVFFHSSPASLLCPPAAPGTIFRYSAILANTESQTYPRQSLLQTPSRAPVLDTRGIRGH